MGRLEGKVAFITGAARGQGRAHAAKLASEGADIITIDILDDIPTVRNKGSRPEDMDETVNLVEKQDRRIVTHRGDVRDLAAVQAAVDKGLEQLGRIDIIVAQAGVMAVPRFMWEFSEEEWHATIDINLNGVWNAVKAAVPAMIEADRGGSIVMTSSVAGVKGYPTYGNYVAAKHGVLGIMKVLAQELGPKNIRVNAILPSTVNTPMVQYKEFWQALRPDLEDPTVDDAREWFDQSVLLPGAGMVEPEDIANAAAFLCSDDARFVTGMDFRVDAGFFIK
jgi:(+)-trans-carveol dehydrogenase